MFIANLDVEAMAKRGFGVVHGFIKRTQKTPKAEIDLALARMKEVLE